MHFYESPKSLINDQDQFEKDIVEFINGHIDPVKFKAIRVAMGVYEQRQEQTYMIRIRCAAGGITPNQLIKVAELGKKYGSGEVHFTTRSEVQIHNVLIENVMSSIRGLSEVGLSSRGGGGNTIRNILTSPHSGVDPEEVFDVDPYAMALTTRMVHEPDSWNLPRKFKIALSNGPKDTAFTQATCLGFVATIENGQKGFKVYCAGGMGAKPMVGNKLLDFIPDSKVYHVTKALKIMFDKHGNRRNKFSNRLKFLWKKLDREEFLRFFEEEYNKLKEDTSLDLVLPEMVNTAKEVDLQVEEPKGDDFDLWKKRHVFHQTQADLVSVKVSLRLGDLIEEDAVKICHFIAQFGENTIRCGRAQNMLLRNIPKKYLPNLYNVMKSLKSTIAFEPNMVSNMINCTGAQTCKLGICLPRGLSDALRNRFNNSNLDLDAIPNFRLNMSGCPNTCGMHHIADLGFFGKIGRKDGEIYPAYNVLTGAKTGAGITEYAQRQGDIAVHYIPELVHDFLQHYIGEKDEYDTYHDYLEAEGNDLIKSLCAKYKDVPTYQEDPNLYQDFGAKKKLSLEDMGSAECSAGMFDMINVDKKWIEKYINDLKDQSENAEETTYKILFHASRMLLVTRGLDAKTDAQAFEYFNKHFVQTNLVDPVYNDIVTLGKLGIKAELAAHQEAVVKMANEVLALYTSMDDSLRFKTDIKKQDSKEFERSEKDYRGVKCPMNFVKTKLALETLNSGDHLQILLDEGEPINNVPNSVKLEGHKILKQEKDSLGHWTVLIEKA